MFLLLNLLIFLTMQLDPIDEAYFEEMYQLLYHKVPEDSIVANYSTENIDNFTNFCFLISETENLNNPPLNVDIIETVKHSSLSTKG